MITTRLQESLAPAQTSRKVYHPELDVLRFVAFLLVFGFHVLPAATAHHSLTGRILLSIRDCGAFGVCIFFLLSSFLITRLLILEKATTGAIHTKAFYVRRILRIWPLYLFFIAASIFAAALHAPYALGPARVAAFLLMAGNWYVAFHGFGASPLVPLWSISIEEQYYVLWPPLVRYCNERALKIFSIVVGVVSYAVLLWIGLRQFDLDVFTWVNTFVQFQFFAGGTILAIYYRKRPKPVSTGLRLFQLATGFLLFFLADFLFHIKTPLAHAGPGTPAGYLMVLAGAALIITGTLDTSVPQWMKPAIFLGKISYGLYVFHYVVIDTVSYLVARAHLTPHKAVAVVAPVSLVLTVGVATLSYRFLESPFLRLKDKFTFVQSRNV